MMDRQAIEALLPHRGPMLLLDGVLELEPGVRAIGVHQVLHDAFWVHGHFPHAPVMPGVLIAEAMAQLAGVVALSQHLEQRPTAVYLVGFDKLRFRRPVRPGELLRLEVSAGRRRRSMWTFEGSAMVGDERAASGSFLATLA